jgi:hypothetical protein
MTVSRRWLLLLVPLSVIRGQSRPANGVGVTLRTVSSSLDFPVYLTAAPSDPRLFVVEKGGRVRVIKNGQLLPTPWRQLRLGHV